MTTVLDPTPAPGEPPAVAWSDLRSPAVPQSVRGAAALLMSYAQQTGQLDEEVDTAMADLIADLYLIADAIGLDWAAIERRAASYHDADINDIGGWSDE